MKKFLRQPGGVGQYGDVSVEWQPGHKPELTVMDGDRVVKTIDLSEYKYDGLHTLFESHFTRNATKAAPDRGSFVSRWLSRRHGEGHRPQRTHHR